VVVRRGIWRGFQSQERGAAVNLVTKVRDRAGGLYGQAKAKYTASDTMQKAGQHAGQAAGTVASQVKGLAGKASGAVKDARAKRPAQR
jgi:hypothetical protein